MGKRAAPLLSWAMNAARPSSSLRTKVLVTLLGVAAALFASGCTSYSPERNLSLLLDTAPAPRLVEAGREFATADRMAKADNGDIAFAGVGSSMEPMYVSGAAIIVRRCDFDSLRAGMAVVYMNNRGHHVAHMLLENTTKGWIAIGVNNKEPDTDLVTPWNLVGVVREAYVANTTTLHPLVAARVALRDSLERGTYASVTR